MSTEPSVQNDYLNEVIGTRAQVEQELKRQQVLAAPKPAVRARAGDSIDMDCVARVEVPGLKGATLAPAVNYRITGFWRWKTVVVPPHVYVVHTRRGYPEPVTLGLGTSFRFDPATDAFLLIPASMQTIAINAKCIASERQGVLVQAYVQWIIDDLATAYRRLDFSDPADPMRIVNVQLREQAEAVVKDKVATMSIDQVLTDKLPIIEELTQRLRLLAEGTSTGRDSSGLGLKIVTVQIKEAVVSSARLWEHLQKPFRAEREQLARLAEMETERRLAERRAAIEQERYDREQAEKGRRHRLEQEAEQRALSETNQTEMARKAAALELTLKELELEAKRVEQEVGSIRRQAGLDEVRHEQELRRTQAALQLEEERSKAEAVRAERQVAVLKARRAVENDLSAEYVKARLVERMPEIAAALPKPEELRSVSIGGDGGGTGPLLAFLAGALSLTEDALKKRTASNGAVN
jgi:regulator of protease activity HflC (stomatin/prohibitin superfamily)